MLYVAKGDGRNRVVGYTEGFHATQIGRSGNSVSSQTAMRIGFQIELLADALDARDVEGLQTLASGLGAMARQHRIESIAVAAEKIQVAAAQDNLQWMNLLRDTQVLLELCRSTQNASLEQAAKPEATFAPAMPGPAIQPTDGYSS